MERDLPLFTPYRLLNPFNTLVMGSFFSSNFKFWFSTVFFLVFFPSCLRGWVDDFTFTLRVNPLMTKILFVRLHRRRAPFSSM